MDEAVVVEQSLVDSVERVVTDLVRRRVRTGDSGALADPHADLAALGVDSVALVELIVQLEEAYSISFPSTMLDRSTFRSVSSIVDAVTTLRQPAAAPRPAAAPGATPPLLMLDWAEDLGVDGTMQRLGFDLGPRAVPIPKTAAATGRSLVTNGKLGADLIHVPAGNGFAPHTHPGDHLLFVVGGRGTITVGGVITETRAGQVYMIDGAVPHAVGAITDHVILAIGSPHRGIEDPERQNLIEYSALLTPISSIACQICGVTAEGHQDLSELGCPHSPNRFA
ncbi:phosphopantetheine-binding protein [Micromonospora sp. NPDC023644]|uniref:phosphopantetheine-binding protein n=1 Tax=Micromonospora sp. NPDC023644 TaxID=3154321 RepID=UPI0033F5B997